MRSIASVQCVNASDEHADLGSNQISIVLKESTHACNLLDEMTGVIFVSVFIASSTYSDQGRTY